MFFTIDNQRGILSTKFDNYLAMHEEPEHIIYCRTYRSARTVLYMEIYFLSINRCIGVYNTKLPNFRCID